MSNLELIKQLATRLKKFSWLIVVIAVIFGVLFFYLAKQGIVTYTAKSTVFPLNSTDNNTISTGTIGNLLGLSDGSKSFSSEATINIVELSNSRRTREAVAAARVPELENKTIATLLVEEYNRHVGFMKNEKELVIKDSAALINTASGMLGGAFSSKVNKNGTLELYYSNTSPELVKEVSYIFIDKISQFYIDLKKKKAQIDYEFAVKKADSLRTILNELDNRAIKLDESTFFTNEELKRFSLPKLNLANDKQAVQSQYYYAVNNREAAAYKLQKETPIIETLDIAKEPFDANKKNPKLYAVIGFLLGLVIGMVVISWKVISKYVGAELNKAIEKATQAKDENVLKPLPEAVEK